MKDLSKYEDIHSYVEDALRKKSGTVADKLHAGRSRNDQVATDVALYLKHQLTLISEKLKSVTRLLLKISRKESATVMPGYTHMQPAQAVTLGAHLVAYSSMFVRDIERIQNTIKMHDYCPLGSSAIAGTSIPVNRNFLAKKLKFQGPTTSAMDTVANRDFVTDTVYASSMILLHLSRLSEEIILWSSPAYGFIDLPDEFSTGSSLMPQKRNPDLSELTRGKSAKGVSSLAGIYTLQKGLPLTYNRDLQEDKIYLFDIIDTVNSVLNIHMKMVPALSFNRKKMGDAVSIGFMESTDLAEYLVLKGVPFRDAHDIAGKIVLHAEKNGKRLCELSLKELTVYSGSIQKDVLKILKPGSGPGRKRTTGSTSPADVLKQINILKKKGRL